MLNSPGWRREGKKYFNLGLIFGGLTSGSVLAAAAWLMPAIPTWLAAVVVLLLIAYAIAHSYGLVAKLPEARRQVQRRVHRKGGKVGGFQFGFEMGTGVRTFSPTALPHLCAVGLVVVAEPWTCLIAGLGFALGRAAVPRWSGTEATWASFQVRFGMSFARAAVVAGSATILVALLATA